MFHELVCHCVGAFVHMRGWGGGGGGGGYWGFPYPWVEAMGFCPSQFHSGSEGHGSNRRGAAADSLLRVQVPHQCPIIDNCALVVYVVNTSGSFGPTKIGVNFPLVTHITPNVQSKSCSDVRVPCWCSGEISFLEPGSFYWVKFQGQRPLTSGRCSVLMFWRIVFLFRESDSYFWLKLDVPVSNVYDQRSVVVSDVVVVCPGGLQTP